MTDRVRMREILDNATGNTGGSPLTPYGEAILDAMSTYAAEREAAERKRAATIADDYCAEKKYPSITELGDRIRRTPEASAPQPMAGMTIEDVEAWLEREAIPYEVVPLGVVGDLRAKLERLVPSQPDTGTKDWREELAGVLRSIHPTMGVGNMDEYRLCNRIADALEARRK